MAVDVPADQKQENGVWVVEHEIGSIGTVHPTELAALRTVNDQGYGTAIFIPWGYSLWETKEMYRKQQEEAERASSAE